MRSVCLAAALRSWLVFWLLMVLIFFTGRVCLFAVYIDVTVKQRYADDVVALFGKGLLFDIKTASILTSVLVLPGLLCLLSRAAMRIYQACLPKLLSLLGGLVVAASVANFFYFQVYERQFDVFVFSLPEEGTATGHDLGGLSGGAGSIRSAAGDLAAALPVCLFG